MPAFYDLTGQRFGRLTVIRCSRRPGAGADGRVLPTQWFCLCDCGGEANPIGAALKNGNTKSCGCLSREMLNERSRVHGLTRTTEHSIWVMMKQRCRNSSNADYRHYGARGIDVCDEWVGDFARFLSDMGPRPSKKHSLERLDNDQGYSKLNCCWATWDVQSSNRRDCRYFTLQGVVPKFRDCPTVEGRLRSGVAPEQAFLPTPEFSLLRKNKEVLYAHN